MSSSTVRATCPGCQQPLRIPRELLGQAVKCKKCGTVIRSTGKKASPPAAAAPAVYPAPQGQPYYPPPGAHPQAYAHPAAHAYAPPPGYQHPQAVPAHDPLAIELPNSRATQAYKGRGRYKKGGGNSTALYLTIAFGLFLIAGATAAAIYLPGYVKRNQGAVASKPEVEPAKPQPGTQPASSPTAPVFGPMPRRMLFVSVNNYLYLNPLTSAAPTGRGYGPDRTRAVAKRLSYDWRVNTEKDNNQLYVLSDIGPSNESRAPYKNVLNETFQKFFTTSRPQDRILVYFGGHATEVEGKAYLVPIEGDPEDVPSLIPLDEVYAQLAACPAQQKVVIWDVCRYNPQRGKTRKGSEPMSEALEKALTSNLPPGVEAVLTCSKDQNALEFYGQQVPGETSDNSVTGSNFLAAAIHVANKTKNKAKGVSPTDPLPVQEWVEALGKRANDVAKSLPPEDGKPVAQTAKIVGSPKAEQVAYEPNQPMPTRFELPQPPRGASPDLVAAIRDEMKLPSLLRSQEEDNSLGSFPFPADKLEPFKSTLTLAQIEGDKETHKFEAAVLDTYRVLRDVWEGKAEGVTTPTELRETFPKEANDAEKKVVKEQQIYPALAISALEETRKRLEKLAPERESASKRWQANYDYALAETKARLAYMHEYDLLLGATFTPESLPALTDNHIGWRLASKEKMKSKKDVVELRDEAREMFAQIIEQYKGTPWEIQAKRERGIALGLEWQPYSDGSKLMD